MADAEKLTDLNEIITNLARTRQDLALTPGDADSAIVGHLDANLFRAMTAGANESKELVISEKLPTKEEAVAVSSFYAIRRQVLEIIKSDNETATDEAAD